MCIAVAEQFAQAAAITLLATWQQCGHPRTPENTTGVNERHPGGRCRMCRSFYNHLYNQTPTARVAARVASARYRNTPIYIKGKARRGWNYQGHDPAFTWEHYQTMLAAQGGRCAICRRLPNGRRLEADHDHVTGKVRGLLCNGCNRYVISCFEAGTLRHPDLIEQAREYLRRAA